MTTEFNKKAYDNQYIREHYKRVALNLSNEMYERVQAAATAAGEPVSVYIRTAIERRMEDEKNQT